MSHKIGRKIPKMPNTTWPLRKVIKHTVKRQKK
jgi:hypothetical protein